MITRKQIDNKVAEFVAACRLRGIKATHQRVEILRELAGTEEHPDAETVFKNVRKRIPSISLDTVYRTLRMFEDNAVITRVGSMKERARFDANIDKHHHFVCTGCGLIRDFCDDGFDSYNAPLAIPEMGCVDAVHVELRGLCRACQKKI